MQHFALIGNKGRLLGNLDLMIGAYALALGVVLITNDAAFAQVGGLKIEDWTKCSVAKVLQIVNEGVAITYNKT